MDAIIRNVKDIGSADRQALEHVIGQQLAEDQQVVIHVVSVGVSRNAPGKTASDAEKLPDWCNVYQGLTDEAVSSLEETVLRGPTLVALQISRMDAALLDTDILNEVLKQKNAQVVAHASGYLETHGHFAISSLSRYEIIRGLRDAEARSQLSRFATFCQNTRIYSITDAILDRAADLWVHGKRGGHSRSDADIIIAATALERDLTLITGNTAHFAWMPGLTLANWREQ